MNYEQMIEHVTKLAETHRAGKRLTWEAVDFLFAYIDTLELQQRRAQLSIENLHEKYAHEGGKPQIMTVDILKRWIGAIDVPIMTDVFQTTTPNVFYATFALPLYSDHHARIEALGFKTVYTNSSLRNRWMLKWQPPPNDEL